MAARASRVPAASCDILRAEGSHVLDEPHWIEGSRSCFRPLYADRAVRRRSLISLERCFLSQSFVSSVSRACTDLLELMRLAFNYLNYHAASVMYQSCVYFTCGAIVSAGNCLLKAGCVPVSMISVDHAPKNSRGIHPMKESCPTPRGECSGRFIGRLGLVSCGSSGCGEYSRNTCRNLFGVFPLRVCKCPMSLTSPICLVAKVLKHFNRYESEILCSSVVRG